MTLRRLTRALALAATACAGHPDARHAADAIRRNYDIECPSHDLELVETKHWGDGNTFAYNACGIAVELEDRIILPSRPSELGRLTPRDIRQLDERLGLGAPAAVIAAVRKSRGRLCDLISTRELDEPSPLKAADCEKVFDASVKQLGGEGNPETGAWEHWFAFNTWVFRVVQALQRPRCERLILDFTETACECAERRNALSCSDQSFDPASQSARTRAWVEHRKANRTPSEARLHDGFFARVDYAAGALTIDRSSGEHFSGAHQEFAAFVGGSPLPGLALSGGALFQFSVEDPSNRTQMVLLLVSGYPAPRAGLHFDALAGVGTAESDSVLDPLAGAVIGGSIGYELWLGAQTSLGANARVLRSLDVGIESDSFTTLSIGAAFVYH